MSSVHPHSSSSFFLSYSSSSSDSVDSSSSESSLMNRSIRMLLVSIPNAEQIDRSWGVLTLSIVVYSVNRQMFVFFPKNSIPHGIGCIRHTFIASQIELTENRGGSVIWKLQDLSVVQTMNQLGPMILISWLAYDTKQDGEKKKKNGNSHKVFAAHQTIISGIKRARHHTRVFHYSNEVPNSLIASNW